MSDLISHNELNNILDIVVDCVQAKTPEKIREATWKFGQLIGSDKLYWAAPVFAKRKKFAPTPLHDFNISYPEEWIELYKKEKLLRKDPIGQICMTGQGTYFWEDVYQKIPPPKSFLDLKEGAFKLYHGYTHVAAKDSQWSIFSLAGDRIEYTPRTLHLINKIAPYFHEALVHIQQKEQQLPQLTKRERQVLQEVAVGKTSWDVSCILNISEATVKFHLQNVMRKFGVHNRSHAIALAVKQRQIEL